MNRVTVIGAGLAGCEAAYQLSKRGICVDLIEMKPNKKSPAHSNDHFCELVCSNSLRSNALTNAVGLLKEEMRMIGSLIMQEADRHAIPAGSALAVDREKFSEAVHHAVVNDPNINVITEEATTIPGGPCIIASGPLTSEGLMNPIREFLDAKYCYFYDAAAPIVTKESIDFSKVYYKSRYDKGSADYINCPMTKEEFDDFYDTLIRAETVKIKDFEQEVYFEGCMPFEVMAKRGRDTLLFGPMKPVGLGQNGNRPYAVVQLRRDNVEDSLYNIVGFQTHLTYGSQKEVLHKIPGLENAEIVRYGVMHRNTYINSPTVLRQTYQTKKRDDLFFAGQMTGVEGYIESAASGMLAGINMAHLLKNEPLADLDQSTMLGSMAYYITHADPNHFQPMNANFGIMHLNTAENKKDRQEAYAKQTLPLIQEKINNNEL